jgi:hypothetical protein
MTELSIRRNWTMYADIIFEDGTLASTKGGRMFCRSLAHGAFYAGARSTLQALAYMLDHGDIGGLHRTIAQPGRQLRVIAGIAPRKRLH